jgi:hypothetical protein
LSRSRTIDITPDLVAQIAGLRAQGKTLGEIAHAVEWPPLRSLATLAQIAGAMPKRVLGDVAPRGPVYRATVSNRP